MRKSTSVPGKDKVMVYLSAELRRAMSMLAAERGCRNSDLYAEAVGGYLQAARRHPAGSLDAPAMPLAPGCDKLDRILKVLDGHGQFILAIQADTASMVPAVDPRALAVVIAAVLRAGTVGLATPDVRALLDANGFRSVNTTSVRDVLLQTAVVHYRDGRWMDRDAAA
ncbi:hypothetical protein PUR21_21855 [Methylorubrum rhodesianum]|uniref:Ribbon-helix-helix protein CopG domain-containing protein n=1 Tax=Methylorubrum rhodesianum TaxID=29427 RepID=A0ABU9ZFL9_9HYPH